MQRYTCMLLSWAKFLSNKDFQLYGIHFCLYMYTHQLHVYSYRYMRCPHSHTCTSNTHTHTHTHTHFSPSFRSCSGPSSQTASCHPQSPVSPRISRKAWVLGKVKVWLPSAHQMGAEIIYTPETTGWHHQRYGKLIKTVHTEEALSYVQVHPWQLGV